MRLLICAGGTGGGVYPALTVLAHLMGEAGPQPAGRQAALPPEERRKRTPEVLSVLWVGGSGGMEADLVEREGIPFQAIPAAGVVGVGKALPRNLWLLGRGFAAARWILRQYRPEVLFFTGGFLAVPVALAARIPGLPFRRPRSLLYVPDIEPGLALKSLTRFADAIAVSADEALAYFPERGRVQVQVTGYPIRPALQAWAGKSREEALQQLGLSPALPVLLVTGGSRGARSINRAMLEALPALLADTQVLHVTGNLDWPAVQAAWDELAPSLSPEAAGRYRAYPYLHEEMGPALAAADLAISRAGASTLGEYPAFGLPAILAPYPYTWRFQEVNARYLEGRGAARIIQDGDLASELLPTVQGLLADRDGLQAMRSAMRSLARPLAGAEIGSLLTSLATGGE